MTDLLKTAAAATSDAVHDEAAETSRFIWATIVGMVLMGTLALHLGATGLPALAITAMPLGVAILVYEVPRLALDVKLIRARRRA